VVRGKPENFNRPDYNFRLDGNDGGEPRGDERVQITHAPRGAPLDLIVAEAMILANSTWGAGWPSAACRASTAARPAWRRASRCAWASSRAARRHGRGAVHLGHVAAAPLRRPRQPVADHRLRAPRPHRGAGGAVQAEGRGAVLDHLGFDAAYAAYNGFQSASSATGRCSTWRRTASTSSTPR
jgi:exoribonuclease-2